MWEYTTEYEAEVTLYGVSLTSADSDLAAVLQRARTLVANTGTTVYVRRRRSPLFSTTRLVATIDPSGCTYASGLLGDELTEILSVFADAVDAQEVKK